MQPEEQAWIKSDSEQEINMKKFIQTHAPFIEGLDHMSSAQLVYHTAQCFVKLIRERGDEPECDEVPSVYDEKELSQAYTTLAKQYFTVRNTEREVGPVITFRFYFGHHMEKYIMPTYDNQIWDLFEIIGRVKSLSKRAKDVVIWCIHNGVPVQPIKYKQISLVFDDEPSSLITLFP